MNEIIARIELLKAKQKQDLAVLILFGIYWIITVILILIFVTPKTQLFFTIFGSIIASLLIVSFCVVFDNYYLQKKRELVFYKNLLHERSSNIKVLGSVQLERTTIRKGIQLWYFIYKSERYYVLDFININQLNFEDVKEVFLIGNFIYRIGKND